MNTLTRLMTASIIALVIHTSACSDHEGRDDAGFGGGSPATGGSSDGTPTSGGGASTDGSTSSTSTGTGTGTSTSTSTSTGTGTSTSTSTGTSTSGSTNNEPGTGGEACNDPPGTPVDPKYSLGPKFADHYGIYDLGEVPGNDVMIGGTVIKSSDPDVLLIISAPGLPPAQILRIGLTRGPCGHITGFQGVAQAIAEVPQAQSIIFANEDLMLVTVTPTNRLYQILSGDDTPSLAYDFDVMKEVQYSASGIAIVPKSYGLGVPTLCFSSYALGAFTCGEITAKGPLVEFSGLKKLSTYGPGNGFAYLPDDLNLPVFAPHSMLGSTTVFDDVFAYRCDKDGVPIFESGEPFVVGDTHNVSIDPIAGDVLVSTINYPGDPFNHLLLVRPRTPIAN